MRFKPGDRVSHYDVNADAWDFGSLVDYTVSGDRAVIRPDTEGEPAYVVPNNQLFTAELGKYLSRLKYAGHSKSYALIGLVVGDGEHVLSVKDEDGVTYEREDPYAGAVLTPIRELYLDGVDTELPLMTNPPRHLEFYVIGKDAAAIPSIVIETENFDVQVAYAKVLLLKPSPSIEEIVDIEIHNDAEYDRLHEQYREYLRQVEQFISIFGPATYIDVDPRFHTWPSFEMLARWGEFRIGSAAYTISKDGPTLDFVVSGRLTAFVDAVRQAPVQCARCSEFMSLDDEAAKRIFPTDFTVRALHANNHDEGSPLTCVQCADFLYRGVGLCGECSAQQFPKKGANNGE